MTIGLEQNKPNQSPSTAGRGQGAVAKIYTSIKDEYYCRTATGQRTPTYKHKKLGDALTEAERLAIKHGCKVEVLKVVAEVSREPITIVATKIVHTSHIKDEDELPF